MALPRSILLIISGSVASYKALELIRLLKKEGVEVHGILTKGGAQFITPLAVSSLTGTKTYDDLFSLTDEVEMGHIQLSRIAELVVIAPASADLLAKMANGEASDLSTTALLATDKKVVVAPAMNHRMWSHAATQRNVAQLRADGVGIIEPTEGEMACGEFGVGRMAEPEAIIAYLKEHAASGPLSGRKAIVTSGPTAEPLDDVRSLSNHSSGKQGHAIAEALAAAGADVTLISGTDTLPAPRGVKLVHATTAQTMLDAAEKALPADIFVGAAAVADWRPVKPTMGKLKKTGRDPKLTLELVPTVDVLAAIGKHEERPALVIGFAAEADKLSERADAKRLTKGADWVLANLVRGGAVFGAEDNEVLFVTRGGEEKWKRMSKKAVADRLVQEIATHFGAPAKRKGKAS